ncbi:MAG: FHA domain-containing protein [Rickettsiales bacterium]|nr:FHA domain-containing protein [Rickettsiales bacterium]
MDSVNAGDIVRLYTDAEIQFVSNGPAYKVRYIDNATPPQLLLTNTLTGDIETISAGKPLSIGRDPKNDLVLSNGNVSRAHGTIQYIQGSGFVYSHTGKNNAFIQQPDQLRASDSDRIPILSHQRVEARQVHTTMIGDDPHELWVPLKVGTRIAFHRTMPVYTVTQADPDTHTLRLVRQGDGDKRYPREIISTGETVSLGRDGDNKYMLVNSAISRRQGTIGWSKEQGEFVYHVTGAAVPVVHAHDELIKEQKELCEAKELVSIDNAQAKLKQVNELISRVVQYQDQLENVAQLEHSIIDIESWGKRNGGVTEESQLGYALWLESLSFIYESQLSDEQQAHIAKMVGVLKKLAYDRIELRDIEKECEIPAYGKSIPGSEYQERINHYVTRQLDTLEQTGEVYLATGFHSHHTVTRIQKQSDGYLVTTYNAGAEATKAPIGPDNPDGNKVMGVCEKKLAPQVRIKQFVDLLTDKKVRRLYTEDYLNAATEVEACLDKKVLRYKAVVPQKYGNCTTRSTRHALEEAIGDDLVKKFGKHFTDPEVSAGEDLKQALLLRREFIANWIKRQGKGEAEAPKPDGHAARLEAEADHTILENPGKGANAVRS